MSFRFYWTEEPEFCRRDCRLIWTKKFSNFITWSKRNKTRMLREKFPLIFKWRNCYHWFVLSECSVRNVVGFLSVWFKLENSNVIVSIHRSMLWSSENEVACGIPCFSSKVAEDHLRSLFHGWWRNPVQAFGRHFADPIKWIENS